MHKLHSLFTRLLNISVSVLDKHLRRTSLIEIIGISIVCSIVMIIVTPYIWISQNRIERYIEIFSSLLGVFGTGSIFALRYMKLNNAKIRVGIMVGIRKGAILDWLLPPGEVDHRIIELEEGRDRWEEKYGPKRAEWLYIWQSIVTVALFWFDRVVVKLLVRRS